MGFVRPLPGHPGGGRGATWRRKATARTAFCRVRTSLLLLDVGRMMLEHGANPNIQLKRRPPYRDVPQDRGGDTMLAQGATPLLRAARGGDDKFTALLIEYKALVDLPSKEGITPLMAAAGVDYGSRVTRERNRTDEKAYSPHGSSDQGRSKRECPLRHGPRSGRWWQGWSRRLRSR